MFKKIKAIPVGLIKIYQKFISPFLGSNCRFTPSCSLYGQQAIEQHGFFYGSWLLFKRLLKCHPWYKGKVDDPVPETVLNKE